MSLDGAVVNLASWAGNVMMPTMAGAFFAGAVYRYSKGGQFEQLLYGGFASLMCSGMLRALEGFVQNAGPTSADGYWTAVMNLVNWVANVILPVFALTQLAAMAMHMGGVVSEIRIPVVVFVCGLARSEPQPLDSSFAKQPAGVEAG